MTSPRLLSFYAFDPVLSAPDSILDSVSDNNGLREGVNGTTGQPLVRFLNASSAYCKLGSCVTFWAFSSMATMMSAGRITLSSALDFPTFGGAIAFWLFVETEIGNNPLFVSKLLPDSTLSMFQFGLFTNPRATGARTSLVGGGEEYNFLVFRFNLQYKSTSGALVASDVGFFDFSTHPFKQQWQHVMVSFGQSGVKLFRDFTLVETLPLNFSSYEANTSLPVIVGNHPLARRAPAARLDELRFFGFDSPSGDVTAQNLPSLLKPVVPTSTLQTTQPSIASSRSHTAISSSMITPATTTTEATMRTISFATETTQFAHDSDSVAHSSTGPTSATAQKSGSTVAISQFSALDDAALGGIVGGVVALLVIAVAILLLVRRCLRGAPNNPPVDVRQAVALSPPRSNDGHSASSAVQTELSHYGCVQLGAPNRSHYVGLSATEVFGGISRALEARQW